MQFTLATIAAVAAMLNGANAHLRLTEPPTYAPVAGENQFPLKDNGADYPCAASSFQRGAGPTMNPGSGYQMQIQGSAVHGGGSCQISLTYDNPPTKSSKFTVIKSFEGGCPFENGLLNLPANPDHNLPKLPFDIPSDAPSGQATLAWTWFNRVGNREMYMRCSPVTIGGSQAKGNSAFAARPDIFKANIGNSCATVPMQDVKFPNPGSVVVKGGSVGAVAPVGSGCQKAGAVTPTEPKPDTTKPDTPKTTAKDGNNDAPKPTPKPSPSPTPTPKSGDDKPATPKPTQPSNSGAGGDSCSNEGGIVCDGDSAWSVCSFGKKVPMGSVAAGTKCSNGSIVALKLKHRRHARRHAADRRL